MDNGPSREYDVAPDGRFLINTELDSAAAPITLLPHVALVVAAVNAATPGSFTEVDIPVD